MSSRKKQGRGEARSPADGRPAAPAPRRFGLRQALGVAALLALAGWIAYGQTLRAPFFFDDVLYTTNNPARGELWRPWQVVPHRPVLGFSLALNYRLSGLDTWSYHLFNIWIHVMAAWVLFGLVRRTLCGEALAPRFGRHAGSLAFAVALLWVLHPLQTQAVTYIIQRGESLMGLFYLLTLYCAVRAHDSPRRLAWWAAAAAACASSLGTKQVAVTAPLVIALYYWVFLPTGSRLVARRNGKDQRDESDRKDNDEDGCPRSVAGTGLGGPCDVVRASRSPFSRPAVPSPQSPAPSPQPSSLKSVVRAVPTASGPQPPACRWRVWAVIGVVAAVWLGATAWLIWSASHVSGGFGMKLVTPAAYALTQCEVVLHYLKLTLWPRELCLDYQWPIATGFGAVAGWAVVVALLGALTGWGLVRRSGLAFAAAWFFVILAPTSSIMPLADVAVEHRAYLPSAGVIAAVVLGVYRGGALLVERAGSWATPLVKACGWSALAAAALALGFLTVRRNSLYLDQEALWRDTMVKRPDNARAHSNLGVALGQKGRLEEAEEQLREAIRLKPDYADAHSNLGAALGRRGRYREAEECVRQAIALKADHWEAHRNLAVALLNLGRLDEAIAECTTALKLNPYYAEAHNILGNCLFRKGQYQKACEHYREALRLRPSYVDAYSNLGGVCDALGRTEEALENYRKALALDPNFPEALSNLGATLARIGRPAEAIKQYEAALRSNPKAPLTENNLAEALAATGRFDEALTHYLAALALDPNYVDAHYNLALRAQQAARLELAQTHLKEVLRLRPDFGNARALLAQVERELAARPKPPAP